MREEYKKMKFGSNIRGRFQQLERRDMLSAIPFLSSNPGSSNKIYLDFDGHIVTDSHWRNQNKVLGVSSDIYARAYDIDGNDYDGNGVLKSNAFGEDELAYIHLAWRQMSEDFAPFDVDVTTVEPPASYFTNSLLGDPIAHRVLFTSNYDDDPTLPGQGNFWATTNGIDPWSGVAEFDSWAKSSDSPAFVFANGYDGMPRNVWTHPDTGANWGPIQEYAGLIGSHEMGHVFDLRHDGVWAQSAAVNGYLGNPANGYFGDTEYYAGHTSAGTDAPTSWGAIMGGSELRSLTQWSKGDYQGATNSEDDLSIISGKIGYRTDDHGGSITNNVLDPTGATLLTLIDDFTSAAGIIERSSSTTNDYDVFEIDLGSTSVDATIRIDTPAPAIVKQGTGSAVNVAGNFVGVSNLDVEMRIYKENGANPPLLVHTTVSDDATNASHTIVDGSGTYYVVVDGVGYSPTIGANYGYDDYGSLGQYNLTAAVDKTLYYVSTAADQIDATNDDRWFSLREAIIADNSVSDDGIIYVPEGNYMLDITGNGGASVGDLDITDNVEIIGAGPGLSVIDASQLNHRIFDVAGGNTLTLSGVTLTRGDASGITPDVQTLKGGAIIVRNNSSLNLHESALVNNLAGPMGGAIYVAGQGAAATVTDSVIAHDSVFGNLNNHGGGGIHFMNGSLTLGNTIIANNSTEFQIGNNSTGDIYGDPNNLTNEGGNLFGSVPNNFSSILVGQSDPSGRPADYVDPDGVVEYIVTTLDDTARMNSTTSDLSLREAIMLANAAANGSSPDEIWLPAWDFTLTLERIGQETDVSATYGDLDITDSLIIRGVTGETSVSWVQGARVDSVFDLLGDFNQDGLADQSVSGSDYLLWSTQNGSGAVDESNWEVWSADANDDGIVDQDDLDIWNENYANTLSLIGFTA